VANDAVVLKHPLPGSQVPEHIRVQSGLQGGPDQDRTCAYHDDPRRVPPKAVRHATAQRGEDWRCAALEVYEGAPRAGVEKSHALQLLIEQIQVLNGPRGPIRLI
jgi:hypothetical protein